MECTEQDLTPKVTPLAEVQGIIEVWRMDYNHHSPHGSLGHLTTNEFVAQRQEQQIFEEAHCSV